MKTDLVWRFWAASWLITCVLLAQDPPLPGFRIPGLDPIGAPGGQELELSGEFKVSESGREGRLFIKASAQPEWHFYSLTQQRGGPTASTLKVLSPEVAMLRAFIADQKPKVSKNEFFSVPVEEHSGELTWSAPFKLNDGVDAKTLTIRVRFDGQVCQEGGVCIPLSNVIVEAKLAGTLPASAVGEFNNPRVHAKLHGEITPRTVAPGGKVTLRLTATPDPKFHVYAWAERDPNKVSKPTLIAWKETNGWLATKAISSTPPIEHQTGDNGEPVQYYHEQPVTWTVEFNVPADTTPGGYELRGAIGYQTCTNQKCDPPGGAEFHAVIEVAIQANDSAAEPLAFASASYPSIAKLADAAASSIAPAVTSRQNPPSPKVDLPDAAPKWVEPLQYSGPLLSLAELKPKEESEATQHSTVSILAIAFIAGLIMNAMPCVLPVIGLKLLSFVQQAGESRGRIFALNLWYSLGLMSVYMILAALAVFAGLGWGQQFQSATFNIVLSSVVFAFALSFLGVWEIPIPGFAGTSGANKAAEKEGLVGAFFKGALTTVLATPCAGPLLATALAWALKQPPALTFLAFAFIGLGMASPYLLVGANPRLISFLPKPGDWMEKFKHIMGFVLLGTVVYLLTLVPMPLVIPTVALMMGLWAGLWWVGTVPVWEELNKRLRAWAVGGAVAAITGMVAFSWLDDIMVARFNDRVLQAVTESRSDPEKFAATYQVRAEGSTELDWQPYSLPLLSKLLLEEKKAVLVDFTANWCPNCKVNERVALNVAQTKKLIETNGIAAVKADWTDLDDNITQLLETLTGAKTIPVYAIFDPRDPNHPQVITGLITPSSIGKALSKTQSQTATTTAMSRADRQPMN